MNTWQIPIERREKKVRSDAIIVEVVCPICGKSQHFPSYAAKNKRSCGFRLCSSKVRSLAAKARVKPLDERFKESYIVAESGCWEWIGSSREHGYGRIMVNGRVERAHRVSMMLHGKALADDQMACHTCDNPKCVNPDHLYAGDHQSNTKDKNDRNRNAKGERQGISKLTEDNVRKIRASAFGGESYRSIARQYGVDASTIRRVCIGKTWGHVK